MISDSLKKGRAGAAALHLRISPATGARWGLAIRRTGQARTAPQGRPHGKGKLDPHRAFLIELIDQDGDMTVPELAGALEDVISVQAHPDAICRFLRKLGFTSLKRRWSRPRGVAQGSENSATTGSNTACQPSQPARIVLSSFPLIAASSDCRAVDETSVKANQIRQWSWSQRGERRVMDAPFGSWRTQTFITGLTADALIAAWVIKGAVMAHCLSVRVRLLKIASRS